MHLSSFIQIFLAASGIASSAAIASVTVSFPNADRYSDAGDRDRYDTKDTIAQIKRHLEVLGERYLSPSQDLAIEIEDIDRAGRTRYFTRSGASEIRVLNGRADWPSIRLSYTLKSDGKVADSAEVTVSDMNYLMRPSQLASNDTLYFEKRMLEEWFRQRFGEHPPLQR